MSAETTLLSLLLERVRQEPEGVALRVKRRGIYQEITWREYRKEVERVCLGLRAIGLKSGERVAILGDPCPGWIFAEMATLAAGGICYGIYPTSSPVQVSKLLKHGGAAIIFVKDQESADKVLAAADVKTLRKIIVFDLQGMFGYDDPRILPLKELMEQPAEPGLSLEELASGLRADDPALIVFTSGTSGEPRGAVHSHRTLVAGASDYRACLVPPGQTPWRTVCHLPLNHIFEQFNTVMLPLFGAVIPHFGDRLSRPTQTIFEVAPELYASVPRYWQKLADHVLVGLDNTTRLKKTVYDLAMKVGRRSLQCRWQGRRPLWLRFLYGLARQAAFRPILDKVGMKRVKVGVTAGGSIPREVQTLWQIWGVNLRNLYGQTEAGFIAVQEGEFPCPGDVGSPAPSVALQTASDGEILIRAPGTFVGYWEDEVANREAGQSDWVATGDVGLLTPEGRLRIVDRKKDIFITQGGKNISPQGIEDQLRSSPYVSEAVVFGEGQKYLAALIEIDYETVSQWARGRGLLFGGFGDLASSPEVHKLIEQTVGEVNSQLARVEQVKTFRILPRMLDPEVEGEPVTPTRKVKRGTMYDRFRELVDSMYDSKESRRIAGQVAALSESTEPI